MEWYKYTIFLSSTFKDMDAERDAVKFQVVPRLNWHYRHRHVQFQLIDLRIGINTEQMTEEESQDKVLSVCLDGIDSARPFFLCLLGSRYGWVPPEERWHEVVGRLAAEKRQLLAGSRGKSVTELEILYGAIGHNAEHLNRSLFFMRSTDGEDSDRQLSGDAGGEQKEDERQQRLRERIESICWEMDMEEQCAAYRLHWNKEQKRLEGLDSFAELVFQRLCQEIEREMVDAPPPMQWQQQELIATSMLTSALTQGMVERRETEEIVELLKADGQVLLTGHEGTGRSTMLAAVATKMAGLADTLCLTTYVGSTLYSWNTADILRRWIDELQQAAGGQQAAQTETSGMTKKELSVLFIRLVYEAKRSGRRICIFIDDVERLALMLPSDVYLSWVPDDVSLLCTAASGEERPRLHHRKMQFMDAGAPDRHVLAGIISSAEAQCNISLPENLRNEMLAGGTSPLRVKMLLTMFANFSGDDYQKIRRHQGATDMEQINNYLADMYRQTSCLSDAKLFQRMAMAVTERIGMSNTCMMTLQYVALSVTGLDEETLELLFADDWDALHFHLLTQALRGFISEDASTHRWSISSGELRQALLPSAASQQLMYEALAKVLLGYANDDARKCDLLFLCLIMSGNAELGAGLLTTMASNSQLPGDGSWYDKSMPLLLTCNDLAERLLSLCAEYDDTNTVGLLYFFCKSLPKYSHARLICRLEQEALSQITPTGLDARHCYHMASIYSDLFQVHKTPSMLYEQGDISKAGYYLRRSVEAYEECSRKQPDYSDVKNMTAAMRAELKIYR